jgi:hypothetical protein
MPKVELTSNLLRHGDFCPGQGTGATVAEVLDSYLATQGKLRGYVLDEQGRLRRHMIVFVDGRPVIDREKLSDAVAPESQLYIFQALSGG